MTNGFIIRLNIAFSEFTNSLYPRHGLGQVKLYFLIVFSFVMLVYASVPTALAFDNAFAISYFSENDF